MQLRQLCAPPGKNRASTRSREHANGIWTDWSIIDCEDASVESAVADVDKGPPVRHLHANLRTTTRNWPFSVLGFWDKNIGI